MLRSSLVTQRINLVARPLPSALRLAERTSGRLRGFWLRVRLRAIGAHVGKRLSVNRGVQVITTRGAKWYVGDRVSLGAGVILSVGKGASLVIGNDVRITHYTVIGVEFSMSIEDRAQVGEHCSIRDHDHDASATSMHAAAVVCSPVSIGEDSWIGRGVAVLKGSHVGTGAVIGANAVVCGHIPQDAIAVGVPAHVIRIRR
jgi:serine acetyltransferase